MIKSHYLSLINKSNLLTIHEWEGLRKIQYKNLSYTLEGDITHESDPSLPAGRLTLGEKSFRPD